MSRKKTVETDESPEKVAEKRDNFTRLASQRVRRACKDIRSLASLANKSSYTFSGDDIDLIDGHLTAAVSETIAAFRGNGKAESLFGE